MEQIIKKLLLESGYVERTLDLSFFSKEDKSFFFLVNISEDNFTLVKNKDSMKENQEYEAVIDGFKTLVNSGEQITIEKNSSLIMLVKCADINAIENLQQQILFFEEDEYFFKKYVILYTEDSIKGLTSTPLIPKLRAKVHNNESFNKFATLGYKAEISEYLVIMQLFIKLPFLKLGPGIEGFTSLNQKITTVLNTQIALYTSLLENSERLSQVNFSNPDDEDKISVLLNILPYD
jgi:hypothetical protein